ncbi:alpha/beta hydrolase family protein [Rothia nasimurium]|uniref:alpha/beta hydrolase family protein n=1 Tax=Rothia nasimurium TaxID=85336 RepID=UPI003BA0BFF2
MAPENPSIHSTTPPRAITLATVAGFAGATAAAAGLVTGLGSAGLATYFARKILIPPKAPTEDVQVLSLGYSTTDVQGQTPTTIRLEATEKTLAKGTYGFYFSGGAGFAVLGDVLSYSPDDKSVVRPIESIERGDITGIKRGRISGVVATDPGMAGYRYRDIELNLPVGPAPAWLVHPEASLATEEPAHQDGTGAAPSTTWAIMVHGMGATRAETLRALETTQALGLTSLHMSYRNDREAPSSEDGRYGLGFTEWHDVDVAIDYALAHGAQDVVLFGWSMGGAISLQTVDQARNRHAIKALVLDGPAIDWIELIQYHTHINKLPLTIGQLGLKIMSHPALTAVTGLKEPIKFDRLSWPTRANDLTCPTLIIHSVDDLYVPYQPSEALARLSPHVDFVPFHGAPHTREWNVDPELWATTVTTWLQPKL